jgi:hypothetical protein
MKFATLALATAAAVGFAAAAKAETIVGLVDGKTLVTFDTAKPAVSKTMTVTGVDGLVGIDVRPADGKLYGVAMDGSVVTIDPMTGAATRGAKLETMLSDAKVAIVDFNPAADRLRLMGMDGTNLRADVDSGKVITDGALAFDASDMHAGEKPAIVAAAYSNSYGKPEKTAMYDIDATIVALIQQTKPNDGVLAVIGKLQIDPAPTYAFDIHTTADGRNTAWLVAGDMLHTVDLDTGRATGVGVVSGLPGKLTDIAVLPAM